MRNSLPSFGFQSRSAQFTYPFLIFGMLLVHQYVYPENPDLEAVEFTAFLAALIVYVISRKFFKSPALTAYRLQIRLIEKFLEVFIGVMIISSLVHSLVFGFMT